MQHANTYSEISANASVQNQIGASVMGLCFVLGVPGNIITIVFIVHHFRKENFSLHLMLNLAISDLLCLMTLPVWIYYLLHEWIFGSAVCKLLFTVGTVTMNTSVLTVTLMSVHRYLFVLHRTQWARLGRRGETALLGLVWVLACALSVASALKAGTVEKGATVACHRLFTGDGETLAILLVEFLLGFVIPFSVLVTSYCRLHTNVNKTVFFKNQRLTSLVLKIVVTFFIFSSPVYLMFAVEILAYALKPFHPHVAENILAFYEKCANIAISLIFINCCVNPFLYAFASKKLFAGADKSKQDNNAV
ncbi:hypothetical protein ACEWY4_018019 [Coilia grayii]|uniref:G-protein coupled receptors family 1 profile domain-containing protein n=1 Tax=Coilia grayii TaxID=363190 RepID=A0ABD1JIN5_9TELE